MPMESAVNIACGSGGWAMRRRGEAQREIGEFVRERLREECGQNRGKAAEIARATNYTPAHIAQVQQDKRPGAGVGEGFARAMAAYWGMSYAEMEERARERAKQHPIAPVEPPPPSSRAYRPLSELPNWPAAIEGAREKYWTIPDEVWAKVPFAVLPEATEATVDNVGSMGQLIWSIMPGRPRHGKDTTAPHVKELERAPPASGSSTRGPASRPAKRKAQG